MTTTTGARPHPIFLAGHWVESPDPLIIANPAKPSEPAGATFHATPEQYEEAVEAAVKAFEVTRNLPAYERGAILRNISAGIRNRLVRDQRILARRLPPARLLARIRAQASGWAENSSACAVSAARTRSSSMLMACPPRLAGRGRARPARGSRVT